MLEFLLGYLIGSAGSGGPSRPLSSEETLVLVGVTVVIFVLGVRSLVRSIERSL